MKKNSVNVSEEIRKCLREGGEIAPKAIAAELSKKLRRQIKPTYVSLIKSATKRKKGIGGDIVRQASLVALRYGGVAAAQQAIQGMDQQTLNFIVDAGSPERAVARLGKLKSVISMRP